MRAFLKDICLRPSCYACKFKGVSREADITLGDFWGIQNVLPKLDDDKGISLVLVHSVRGQAIFKRIKQHLEYEEVDVMDGAQYNSAMIRSVIRHPDRNTFFKQLDTKPIDKLIDALCKDNFSERIGQRIGTTVRVLLLRLGILDHTKKVVARITGK